MLMASVCMFMLLPATTTIQLKIQLYNSIFNHKQSSYIKLAKSAGNL